jgi:hypothetical protein
LMIDVLRTTVINVKLSPIDATLRQYCQRYQPSKI